MSKDTIIPVKFKKELTTEEIKSFVNVIHDFSESVNVKIEIISISALKKRINQQNSVCEKTTEMLSHSGNDLNDDKMHYELLQECCNKILDAIGEGKVPQKEITGLRLLMNR